jgi:hypothetical protein
MLFEERCERGVSPKRIGERITVTINIIQLDTGIVAVCEDCGKTLDSVPDERTACTKSRVYILHECVPNLENVMNLIGAAVPQYSLTVV